MIRTEHRLRVVGVLFLSILWSLFLTLNATTSVIDRSGAIKGRDFFQFYEAGRFVLDGRRGELQNEAALRAWLQEQMPEVGPRLLVPVYPPHVAGLFAPLAALPYGAAVAHWLTLSAALYVVSCFLLLRTSPWLSAHAPTYWLLAAGAPSVVLLLYYAQLTAVLLLAFTAGYLALRANRPVLAGMALGAVAFKPQLLIVAAAVFLVSRQWRLVLGIAVSTGLHLLASVAVGGVAGTFAYLQTLQRVASNGSLVQQQLYLLQSLSAFFHLLLPSGAATTLYVVGSLAVILVTIRVWRGSAQLAVRYSALLVSTVLASPHVYIYDLLVLTPVLSLLPDQVPATDRRFRRAVVVSLACLYAAPVLGSFSAYFLRVAGTPLVLLVLLALLSAWREASPAVGKAVELPVEAALR